MATAALPPPELSRRVTAAVILLFWTAQFSILSATRLMYAAGDDWSFLPPRLLVTLVGVALSFGIAAFHRRTAGAALGRRLGLAVAAALVCALLHAAANFVIFHAFLAERNWEEASTEGYIYGMLQWSWSYAALSAMLLAATYSGELRGHERRAAQLEREAHAAHLRALRYQLNPHFMFNTLNSIASLVAAREPGPAERMVENLADFLRAGLALDPGEDIPLAREIELQSLYLAIETERFPDRLTVAIDVPEAARGALVPSLIIQPLVENAVRHAIARSTMPVTLTIAARIEGERLAIRVADSGGDGSSVAGTGVGLTNVAERLAARYGEDCGFSAGRSAAGGFVVAFAVPLSETTG